MNAKELTIEVKAKLTVDRDTAACCLKMVEMYCNQNKIKVMANRKENGEEELSFYEPDG